MSMISGLIDKLRKSEQEWNQSNMFELAHMCREAVDIITELRGALQVASVDYRHLQDENAKLREEFNKMDVWHSKELTAAMDENAKLRELVRDAWGNGHSDRSCEDCDIRDECHDDMERLRKDGMLRFSRCLFELRIEDRMRELGVEVDA